jgi:ribonuclease VapC
MVLDTSAIIAILEGESDVLPLMLAIEADPLRLLSAGTLLEAGVVAIARRGEAGGRDLARLLAEAEVEVVPVTPDHVRLALEAFSRHGKGRHPAALNLGDLFAYALARAADQPLLFKGTDFTRTDVVPVALPPVP